MQSIQSEPSAKRSYRRLKINWEDSEQNRAYRRRWMQQWRAENRNEAQATRRRENHKRYMARRRARGVDMYRPHDWKWQEIIYMYLPLLRRR
jgi:hypothetical protein